MGTLIGVVLAAVLAVPATSTLAFVRSDSPGRHRVIDRFLRWLLFWSTRLALNILRSIPELVWVLICILAVGIGPFAGTIALGLHTAGVLGKLYAETMEEVPCGRWKRCIPSVRVPSKSSCGLSGRKLDLC